jgi:hypothetical protein
MRALLPTLRPTLAARRLAARLALFALLVSALVPTFSRLTAPVGPAEWAALCQSSSESPRADAGPRAGSPASDTPQDAHSHGDACVLCSLAHTTPALGGVALAAVAVLAYAPPAPPAPAVVRMRVVQSRAPGARAPPSVA